MNLQAFSPQSVVDHGALAGLTDDDHARYWDKDGSKNVTGNTFRRDGDSNAIQFVGGGSAWYSGAIVCVYGMNHPSRPGQIQFNVPNAAKNGSVEVFHVDGVTDTPYLNMLNHEIKNLLNYKRGAATIPNLAQYVDVTHGCGTMPVSVVCTADSTGAVQTNVTNVGATTFRIGRTTAVGAQVVYWLAVI